MDHDNDRIGLWLLATVALTAFFYCIWRLTAGGDAPFDVAAISWVGLIACSLIGLVAIAILIAASVRAVEWAWTRARAGGRPGGPPS